MIRSIVAVFVGFVVIVAVVIAGTAAATAAWAGPGGAITTPYLVANGIVSLVAAGLGGAIAVRLAPRLPFLHAAALVALLAALALPGLGGSAGQPAVYPAVILAVGVLGVMIGAALAARRRPR